MRRRVVVTGLGMVTPLGTGVEKNWKAVCAGTSGIGPISKFDASKYACRIAGEIKDFRPEDFMDKKQARRFDVFIHYAVASAKMAMEDAGLKINSGNADRIGCITGSGLGGLATMEHYHKVLLDKGPNKISPFFIPGMTSYASMYSDEGRNRETSAPTPFWKESTIEERSSTLKCSSKTTLMAWLRAWSIAVMNA